MLEKYFSNKITNLVFCFFLERSLPSFFRDTVANSLSGHTITIPKKLALNNKHRHLIKNIPNYLLFSDNKEGLGSLKFKDVPQYKGFLLDFSKYQTASQFIENQLSKRNQKNLRAKQKKLEHTHKISHRFYFGCIEKKEYTIIFSAFYQFLKNRFDQKKTQNRYLADWEAMQTEIYGKILNKEASLFVIYDDCAPIGITLNFHLDTIVFSHIQAYNIDYSSYNIGDICMLHHIDWCMANNISVFDLSMGETYYKLKWSNHHYLFLNRLYYNNTAVVDNIWVKTQFFKFKLLQFLRDKQILGNYFSLDKLLYKLK
ncbi:GNAT family N-acetyltransferase [Cellulophaga sp. F20128]|uniref:GNAT family N-acetyltransferase n=1 Tax=Cellulophaga sp. F20128 TaxID=2926413 RepID=UPI001FF0F017|nr:GNAT family N-acetyltransferase [Cellulophaga sp. F20128]MCK0156866.1 GNAT family N-acetyltransferase [Cellulophaga sp. F20128]